MTTSSEQVLPSPTKMRYRKNRHRRSNSRGSLKDITSPVRSPSKDSSQDESKAKRVTLHPGPGLAVRREKKRDSDSSDKNKNQNLEERNLNDVCFGCDGGCSDITCSSKRSSQVSADVESNTCDSPCNSPRHQVHQVYNIVEVENTNQPDFQSKTTIREKDSNENLNCPIDTTDIDMKDMKEITSEDTIIITADYTGPTAADNSKPVVTVSMKRTLSDHELVPARLSPNLPRLRDKSEHKKGNVKFRTIKNSAETTSEEEGEVSEDEARRRTICRQSLSTLSSEGGAFSEEENTSEVSHNTGLMSTNSAENLQLELAKCTYASDGLSDREMTVRKMKNQVSSPPERIFEHPHSDSSSDSDECSNSTIATVQRKRSFEKKQW